MQLAAHVQVHACLLLAALLAPPRLMRSRLASATGKSSPEARISSPAPQASEALICSSFTLKGLARQHCLMVQLCGVADT